MAFLSCFVPHNLVDSSPFGLFFMFKGSFQSFLKFLAGIFPIQVLFREISNFSCWPIKNILFIIEIKHFLENVPN